MIVQFIEEVGIMSTLTINLAVLQSLTEDAVFEMSCDGFSPGILFEVSFYIIPKDSEDDGLCFVILPEVDLRGFVCTVVLRAARITVHLSMRR